MSLVSKLLFHAINALVCCALTIALSGASYASTHDDINFGLTCNHDVSEVFDSSQEDSLSKKSPLNSIDFSHNSHECESRLNGGYKRCDDLLVASWFDALLTAFIIGLVLCEAISIFWARQKKRSYLIPLWRFRSLLLQHKFSQHQ